MGSVYIAALLKLRNSLVNHVKCFDAQDMMLNNFLCTLICKIHSVLEFLDLESKILKLEFGNSQQKILDRFLNFTQKMCVGYLFLGATDLRLFQNNEHNKQFILHKLLQAPHRH